MKNLTLILMSIVFLSFSLKTGNEEWKTHETKYYKIEYPSTWDLNLSGQMNTKFMIFAPTESASDKFKENVNLISEATKAEQTLDTYIKTSIEQIKKVLSGVKIIEDKRIKNNNDEYHKLVYQVKQGAFNLNILQNIRIVKNKSYVLTFTAEKSKYKSYLPTAEKIMDPFKLK